MNSSVDTFPAWNILDRLLEMMQNSLRRASCVESFETRPLDVLDERWCRLLANFGTSDFELFLAISHIDDGEGVGFKTDFYRAIS